MKTLQKTFAAMIAGVSLVAVASSASAQTTTFTPGEAVQASGTLTQSLFGDNETICNVTFHGTVTGTGTTPTGFKFDSYEGTRVSGGDLACDDSIQFGPDDLVIVGNLNTDTTLNLNHILIETREGNCEQSDVLLSWDGSGVTFPDPTVIFPVCQFAGRLAVSAE